MPLALRNFLIFAIVYEGIFQFASALTSVWNGWRMSDDKLYFSSFYFEYLARFMFVAIAYIAGGLLASLLFKGQKAIVWSWALCIALLVFSPIPFGNASITDVGLPIKIYFLASIHLPPLVLGLVASAFIVLPIRRGVQGHGLREGNWGHPLAAQSQASK
jgi:hypothetical protein